MWKRDLWRSTPVRLASAFALAILLLTGAVFGVVYVQTTDALIQRLQVVFADEAARAAIVDENDLRQALSLRMTRDFRRLDYVALYDASGRLILGNLENRPAVPADGRAHYFDDFKPLPEGPAEPTLFVARTRPGGGVIVLGRSLAEVGIVRRILGQALSFAVLPLAAFALAVGVVFARKTAGRIQAIDKSIAAIMQGDLRARLPTHSGFDELDGVIRSVNMMLNEIERLLDQLASVGDNIAHDLRAPLFNVRAGLERALAGDPANPMRPAIQNALRQIDRAMKAIAALLRISAIENERRRVAFGSIDLSEICVELYEFFLPLAEAKGVSLTLAAPEPIRRLGDPDLMREAVANLIENALKFTPRGGAVCMEARVCAGAMQIVVSDNGRGVPAAEAGTIFRRYARASNGADVPGGGLGLSIAQTIARLHRLELGVADNAPGARFTLQERLTQQEIGASRES